MSPLPRRSGMLSLEIPNLDGHIRRLQRTAPKAVERGLHAGIRAATIDVQGHVKNLIDGPVLNRRTGRLWRSIQPEVFKRGGRIIGIVGTGVKYAPVHEFGGTIRPKSSAGFLMFQGEQGFVMTKQVKIPRRPYMSRALKERRTTVNRLIRNAVMREAKAAVDGTATPRILSAAERRGVGFAYRP